MFHNKCHKPHVWIVAIVLVALVTITLILQAQIFMMLKDMQTSIFSARYIKQEMVLDGNPLPPTKLNTVSDGNPLPPTKTLKRY